MFFSALPAIGVATLIFTLIHIWVIRQVKSAYPSAFKLSRGIAAFVLTAIGFSGLILALPDWHYGFLVREEAGDLLRWGVIIAYGHLLSDFIWMVYGRVKFQVQPRKDLIFHHGLGALAYAVSLQFEVGYGMVMLTLSSEVMPCFTGIEAYGKCKGSEYVQLLAARARLIVLSFWRIPIWIFAFVICVVNLISRSYADGLTIFFQLCAVCLVLILGLDLYWWKRCLLAWKGRVSVA